MEYLTVMYQPVSLFSLKRSDATNMAARSNLVPTPYAIKMALLRLWLEAEGRQYRQDLERGIQPVFNQIRDLQIGILPPEQIVVNRNGYKLRYRDQETNKAEKNRQTLALHGGFVFREWLQYQGNLVICCGGQGAGVWEAQFRQVNYFGKRGCFFQYLPDCTALTPEPPPWLNATATDLMAQPMDDLGPKTTFGKINPFSKQSAKLGVDRLIPNQPLPLRLAATSAHYDLYRRSPL